MNLDSRHNFDLIAPLLSLEDLLRLCQTNSRLNQLCHQESFWELKVRQDYPTHPNHRREGESFRDYYLYLAEKWEVPVIHQFTNKTQLNEAQLITLSVGSISTDLTKLLKTKIEQERAWKRENRIRKPLLPGQLVCLGEGFQLILVVNESSIVGFEYPLKEIRRIIYTGKSLLNHRLEYDVFQIMHFDKLILNREGKFKYDDGSVTIIRDDPKGRNGPLNTELDQIDSMMFRWILNNALDMEERLGEKLPKTRKDKIKLMVEIYRKHHKIFLAEFDEVGEI